MLASRFPWQKYHLRKEHPGPQQDDEPLSAPHEDQVDNGGNQHCSYWGLVLCYVLHAFLVILHLILLGIAVSHHAERRVVIQNDVEAFTTGLSGGLQAFYTLYTALLVFVTQRLMLSSIFSRPKKLTQIHDICSAWAGLGAALSTLWQQTKVASSVLSVALVTVYFVCITVLHITSTTLIQLQLFNDTITSMGPVLATWPNASINITSFDWTTVTALAPFLQDFYGNTTNGLANNTLYDVPLSEFISATVPATTVNANCGLLTNLSIETTQVAGGELNVTASASPLGPVTVAPSGLPFINEIWFPPDIECFQPICSTLIIYLVSAAMEVDNSLSGVNYVYINGTYPGNTGQNFSTPVYLVACSLNVTNHTVVLDSSGIQLHSGVEPTDVAWSAFSPGGDTNLTSAISNAIGSATLSLSSPYCQPVLGDSVMATMPSFNAYLNSILGMGIFPCSEVMPEPLPSTPLLLAKNEFESAVSQFGAEFLWLAGELGSAGGGFDRETEEALIVSSMAQWKLNINTLPVIISLCASVLLFVLAVCSLRSHHPAAVSSAGVLEMMWFGSRSQVLRGHLSDVQAPSLDRLRTSSMFDTVFWTQSTTKYDGNNDLYEPVPLQTLDNRASSSGPLDRSGSETATLRLSDVSRAHKSNSRWCYALHILFVALHIILLALLVRHPEQSVVIPSKTSVFTVGLSALLQGVYTLYTTVLVFLVQRVGLFKIVSKRQKLTTVHDVSGAWTSIGAAINILWQQRKASSSILEVTGVGIYLTLMLVLHIISSSIMQWQAFNAPLTGVVQTDLVLPNSSVYLGQIIWMEVVPAASWIGQSTNLSTPGLSNATVYDVLQNPNDVTFAFATVNATMVTAQCNLVPNLTSSSGGINFQIGTNNSSFPVTPIGTDSLYALAPNYACAECPQTLFYMVTTGMNVDESIQDPVYVGLNFTSSLPSGESTSAIVSTYIVACSVSTQTALASLNIQAGVLETTPNTTTVPASSSWTLWTPGNITNDTDIGDTVADALLMGGVTILNNQGALPSDMDSYVMGLLGLNSSDQTLSTASPSVTLSPWQLENAIAQTVANFLWLAGQVGEDGGGFQRSVGESPAVGSIVQFRLHLNTVPAVVASVAAFSSLILAMFIVGKPSGKRVALVSGTSVLECLWLEAHSESLHAHMETIKAPDLDGLRAAGMFEICLGDIGRSS